MCNFSIAYSARFRLQTLRKRSLRSLPPPLHTILMISLKERKLKLKYIYCANLYNLCTIYRDHFRGGDSNVEIRETSLEHSFKQLEQLE